jgi:hypothetical protein
MFAHAHPEKMTDELLNQLIATLLLLPPDWSVVPVDANKRPLGYNWLSSPLTPPILARQLQRGEGIIWVLNKSGDRYRVRPSGYGLLTGVAPHYFIALDQDGLAGRKQLNSLCRGETLPPTIAFSSGRTGHCQYLYKMPAATKTRKLGNLEIRGTGCMSVLPPSVHPLTKGYQWLCDSHKREVAIAPEWLVQLAIQPRKSSSQVCSYSYREETQTAIKLLRRIRGEWADLYHSWIAVGMALKSVDEGLLTYWEEWSQHSSKYKPGECAYKWHSFKGKGITLSSLYYYASL